MRVFYELEELPAFNNAVITIGSFDGVHLGHAQLLEQIKQLARDRDGESIVVTFHPHPRQIIYPKDNTLRLLNTIDEKITLFERYGVDNVVVVPFTVAFSQQSADEYIQKFVAEKFSPSAIVIGYDHRFGLNRQGDIDYLKWHSKSFGFEVIEIAKHEVDDIGVSSTKIRNALASGEVEKAANLLGYHYRITGEVIHGQHIGTKLGYPTANLAIQPKEKLIPANGIYAVEAELGQERLSGMLYIGDRPSIEGLNEQTIEVNLFDFQRDIYGEELTLEFVSYIRGDAKFASLDELKEQLALDEISARKLLAAQESSLNDLPKKTELAIVILNYNGAEYLRKFLPGVLEHSQGDNIAVIVADNASTDESCSIVREEFSDVRLVSLPHNLGFAEGYNQALASIDANYYVLLNSDIEVSAGWWKPCLRALTDDASVGACQPKIRAFHQPSHFEYAGAAGGWLDKLGYPFCRGRIFATTEPDEKQYDDESEIFWASGAALFVKADIFKAIGGFDGDYFAHAEEIDLCWRLKRAGYRIKVIPEAIVYHVGGGTLNYQSVHKTYLNFRNTLVTSFKNEPKAKLFWWLPLRLLLDGLAGVLFLMQGKFGHIGAIIKAHWHFFPRMAFWRKKRRLYSELIEAERIGPSRVAYGTYSGSIVWSYYGRGVRCFKDLLT